MTPKTPSRHAAPKTSRRASRRKSTPAAPPRKGVPGASATRIPARAGPAPKPAASTTPPPAMMRSLAPRRAGGAAVTSITPFLWFDGDFEEAARFYVGLFPGSSLDGVHAMGGSFTLAGQRFMGLNGGPMYKFTPAVSFFVVCRDQAEVDRLWDALSKGGKPNRCGWIDDRFGLTWQIVPQAFLDLTSGPPAKSQAVFAAMMKMGKMIVKDLEAAYAAA